MRAVVFIGPTLSVAEGAEILPSAEFRGPAACGDVYRAFGEGFELIGLCDGYFEHSPSVWHKEVLWALRGGARVFGAASMGALRAAELHSFGMVGVGRVFDQFRTGLLVDDDEVAVLHESEQTHYRCVSEAMVNIRATLDRAVELGILSQPDALRCCASAKTLFYGERRFDTLLSAAQAVGLAPAVASRVAAWVVEHGVVDQKREDARAMLTRMREEMAAPSLNARCEFEFEYTDAWHAFRQSLEGKREGRADADTLALGQAIHTQRSPASPLAQSFERALAIQLALRENVAPSADEVQAHSELIRRRLGLRTPESTQAWLRANALDVKAFSLLVYEDWFYARYRERTRALAAEQSAATTALGANPSDE